MGNGDIVVGGKPTTRKSEPLIIENLVERTGASLPMESIPARTERHCGAMSQQRGDSGTISTPQKFVHLIGYRDSKLRQPGSR